MKVNRGRGYSNFKKSRYDENEDIYKLARQIFHLAILHEMLETPSVL